MIRWRARLHAMVERGSENTRVGSGIGRAPVVACALAVAALLCMVVLHLAPVAGGLICAGAIGVFALGYSLARAPGGPPMGGSLTQTARQTPFDLMLESLEDPILLVVGADPGDLSDRRFLFANRAARALLRLQRTAGPLTTAVRAPEVLAAVEDALFGQGAAQAAWQSRGVQEQFWRARVVRLPGGAPETSGERLAVLTFRDETEIRRSESTRADFLANASHELRTPLASLAGFVETLRGHARDDPDARDRFLAIMQVQAERMRRLIDDLMSLSRIELSEHIRPSGQVDLASAVMGVIEALAPQATGRRVTFRTTLPPSGEALALGDRDQIVQVAQNLVENAVKYTPAGGTVEVDVRADVDAVTAAAPMTTTSAHLSLLTPDPAAGQRYAVLTVRDSGAGIARNHLPRLTERFYRVEGQKARERPGTGLGLAIVKHIVNRHRGGVTVESTPGSGSAFTVYIPVAQEIAPAAPPPPVLRPVFGGA